MKESAEVVVSMITGVLFVVFAYCWALNVTGEPITFCELLCQFGEEAWKYVR